MTQGRPEPGVLLGEPLLELVKSFESVRESVSGVFTHFCVRLAFVLEDGILGGGGKGAWSWRRHNVRPWKRMGSALGPVASAKVVTSLAVLSSYAASRLLRSSCP